MTDSEGTVVVDEIVVVVVGGSVVCGDDVVVGLLEEVATMKVDVVLVVSWMLVLGAIVLTVVIVGA